MQLSQTGAHLSLKGKFDMTLNAQNKAAIVADYQRGQGDTGSSEVQIALLTARINDLTPGSR